MLASTVRFSLRYRGVVVALAFLLLGYGAYDLARAGLDIFPEFSPRQVIVQTEAPGLSTEQVEVLVTQPIENALGGLIGLARLRSESIQGLSIVTVVFAEDADVYRIRQLVAERLATVAATLPTGTGPPIPVPLASSSATILTIGVTSRERDLMQLRGTVDWTIVPRILAVTGVADVNVFGGEVRQLQIRPDAARLRRIGMGIDEVVAAARQATGIRGAGFIDNPNQRIALQGGGLPVTPADLARVVIRRDGTANVRLADVADIDYGAEPPIGAAQVMGEPGIVMMVIGQYGANTLTVSRAVEAALAELEPVLAADAINLHTQLFRPANYIETSLRNISGHLLVGAAFVVIVLFLFLFDLRTAFISAIAIPLSLITAVVVLLEFGINLNIMVIGGLAIALGEVVDDAIIDTENIFRRLRENRLLAAPRSPAEVVFDASMEVRGSVVYASFIVALVFVPLLTLSGITGRLFAPLGLSYILAILASLLVALTVTPGLCYVLLGSGRLREREPPLIARLKPGYAALLRHGAHRPALAISMSVAVCAAGAALVPTLGARFLPDLREGHFIVHTASAAGTSLAESIRIGTRLTREFLDIRGVRSVSQWAGRAERGADTFGSHYSEYEVDLEPLSGAGQQRVLETMRARLREFPGLLYETETFLTERVNETISGYTSPVVVNLYGNDLERLDHQARALAVLISSMAGATDVQVRSPPGTPLLRVDLRLDDLARWGLKPLDVLDVVQVAYEGAIVGRVADGNRLYEVAVIASPARRTQPDDVAALPLRAPGGEMLRLADVADVRQASGRYNILHHNAQRVQTVTCNVSGRDLASFTQELRQRILATMRFDAGSYPEITGAGVEQAVAREQLILHSVVVGFGVLLLMYVAIGSLRHVAIMLLNLPFALVGGVVAAVAAGGVLSIGSMVGFVTLFGITVRNSIMLVSHYRYLVERQGAPWDLDTAVRGAGERLPSILMTALVTALAMLPIAIGSDNPGREIMGPMAAVIVGGLVSSTLLNLAILPTVMLRYGRFAVAGSR
ncbi:MAG: efflux RND transporter permease subunit [Gammaproteobacteria bacterium]|nr:efflux RND transporter permease subunit [Gammaproteobacteria bacterium]